MSKDCQLIEFLRSQMGAKKCQLSPLKFGMYVCFHEHFVSVVLLVFLIVVF